ncbi:enterobactin exporter EntS [Caulifigura coniformis]|uniref:Enterobactin exporter EntS n=1 Tax=Caulifigura coniformis TaxID=2527983 RepID=A0A517SG57_9PLAN|nr:MFS transporter [Caulifigura coniformis]QDT55112.1 enterobactin exporter EntS [Caulifigura coniformis]
MDESLAGHAPHDPYLAFRHPVYRRFALSYVLAVIGSQILATAVQWDVYALTGSPLALGWLGGLNALPLVLLSLPAGHVVDVMPRRRILLTTQAILITIPWTMALLVDHVRGDARTLLLFVLSGLNAVTLTFARPARVSLLPSIIPRSLYGNAFTWNSSLFETSSWMGPAITGLLLIRGVEWAYWSSGICMAGCMALTLGLPNPPPSESSRSVTYEAMLKGLRFVWRTPLLISSMTLDMLAVLLGGATYLLPMFTKEIIAAPTSGVMIASESTRYGLLRAAPAFGAAAMAVTLAHLPLTRNTGRKLLWSVAGFGAATIVFGLSTNFWLSLAMLVLVGACDNISVVVRNTLVQTITPDSMRGRVSAVNQVFVGASNEIGGLESGVAARYLGAVAAVVAGGVGSIFVVAGIALRWPELRRLQSLRELQPAPVDEPRLGEPAI